MSKDVPSDPWERPALAVWEESRPGRVSVAWSLAGGVTAGGLLVTAVSLAGSLSASMASTVATILFVLGAAAGFVHGGLLGYLGRDLSRSRAHAFRGVAFGLLLLLPSAPVVWLFTILLALSVASLGSGRFELQLGAVAGWMVGLSLCAWAAWEGWLALKVVWARWPGRREGSLIMAGVLAILSLNFVTTRPEIWGTDIRVTGAGALILAFGATTWIALPVVLATLHLFHRVMGGRASGQDRDG